MSFISILKNIVTDKRKSKRVLELRIQNFQQGTKIEITLLSGLRREGVFLEYSKDDEVIINSRGRIDGIPFDDIKDIDTVYAAANEGPEETKATDEPENGIEDDAPLGTAYTGVIYAYYPQKFGFITESKHHLTFYFRENMVMDPLLLESLRDGETHQLVRFLKISHSTSAKKYPCAKILEKLDNLPSSPAPDNQNNYPRGNSNFDKACRANLSGDYVQAKILFKKVIDERTPADKVFSAIKNYATIVNQTDSQEACNFLDAYREEFPEENRASIDLMKAKFLARIHLYDQSAMLLDNVIKTGKNLSPAKIRTYQREEAYYLYCAGETEKALNLLKDFPANDVLAQNLIARMNSTPVFTPPSTNGMENEISTENYVFDDVLLRDLLLTRFDRIPRELTEDEIDLSLLQRVKKSQCDVFQKNSYDKVSHFYVNHDFTETNLQFELFKVHIYKKILEDDPASLEARNLTLSVSNVYLRKALCCASGQDEDLMIATRSLCILSLLNSLSLKNQAIRCLLLFILTYQKPSEKILGAIWDQSKKAEEVLIETINLYLPDQNLLTRVLADLKKYLILFPTEKLDIYSEDVYSDLNELKRFSPHIYILWLMNYICKHSIPQIQNSLEISASELYYAKLSSLINATKSFLSDNLALNNVWMLFESLVSSMSHADEKKSLIQLCFDKFRDYSSCMSYSKKEINKNSFDTIIQTFCNAYLGNETDLIMTHYVYPFLLRLQKELTRDFIQLQQTAPKLSLTHVKGNSYCIKQNSVELQLLLHSEDPVSAPISNIALFLWEKGEEEGLLNAKLLGGEGILAGGETIKAELSFDPTVDQMRAKTFKLPIGISYSLCGKQQMLKEPMIISLTLELDQFEPLPNPYAEFEGGAYVSGELFVGREDLIDEIVQHFTEADLGQCYLLHGQKRSGKSSIMENIESSLKSFSCIYTKTTMKSNISESDNLSFWFAQQILTKLKVLLPDFSYDPDRLKSDPRLELEVTGRFLASKKLRWVVAIDEFTYLLDGLGYETYDMVEAFLRDLKALLQQKVFSLLIVAQDTIDELFQAFPNELAITKRRRITYLSRSATEQLASKPILRPDGSSRFSKEAIDLLFKLTYGHPFYLQKFCYRLVKYLNERFFSSITDQEIKAIAEEMTDGINCLSMRDWDGLYGIKGKDFSSKNSDEIPPFLYAVAQKNSDSRWCPVEELMSIDRYQEYLEIFRRKGTIEIKNKKIHICIELFTNWLNCHNLETVMKNE